MARWRATPASPCPKTRAFGYDCNNRHKLEADGEDAARQTLPYDQGIPLGSSRLASHNSHSATATAARTTDPECPSPERAGGRPRRRRCPDRAGDNRAPPPSHKPPSVADLSIPHWDAQLPKGAGFRGGRASGSVTRTGTETRSSEPQTGLSMQSRLHDCAETSSTLATAASCSLPYTWVWTGRAVQAGCDDLEMIVSRICMERPCGASRM